jgi:hypothetical protein
MGARSSIKPMTWPYALVQRVLPVAGSQTLEEFGSWDLETVSEMLDSSTPAGFEPAISCVKGGQQRSLGSAETPTGTAFWRV